ncbi:Protein CBR-WDR-5.2 [Caenorhabditis briggsae]|uniref:WDR5-like beta-propeller domain-containing protein n=2 Tax=Caenorhabditis briggsae TaxID=6238 RepID=A0AAE8ZVS3_CAEBR|nr:Protein CBR-WDR-5.2 [Caenorhabditis briggsae]ULT85254.1 hypothetical protein L3Y34_013794 [Caenorhabditis briggsae]CAP28641.1 Protein CBR-WDR-5.2 [Caenorhabditis briggsae]
MNRQNPMNLNAAMANLIAAGQQPQMPPMQVPIPGHTLPPFLRQPQRPVPIATPMPVMTPAPAVVAPNYQKIAEIPDAHAKSVSCLKFSPNGRYLGSSGADRVIKIYNTHDFALEKMLTGHKLGINEFVWSSDSKVIFSVSDDKNVKMYDVDNVQCLKTMRGHTNYVFCIAVNPAGTHAASGAFDETVRVWDTRLGVCIRVLPAHQDPVTGVIFNRDGTLIASCSYDGFIRIWETEHYTCCKSLVEEDNPPVSHIKFSPNGKFILSSNLDDTLRLWDFGKGRNIKDYTGHLNSKYCIAAHFSITGGKWIVSGSENGRIVVWNIQTREVVQEIEAHDTDVMNTDCHPLTNMIASAGIEPELCIRIWKSDT